MKKAKKRVIKLLLWIALTLTVLIICGYFVFSYLRTTDKSVAQDEFSNATYISADGEGVLRFGDGAASATLRTADGTYVCTVEYTENIIIITDSGITFEFLVLDEKTIYSGKGYYLFRYVAEE